MVELSQFVRVKQQFPAHQVPDIPAAVRDEVRSSGMLDGLAPGAGVAIGVGSRGIANLAVIVKALVEQCRERGFQPFLFPAMGSHGAATAAGQVEVLRRYGVDESSMGCPVRSDLDVVSLGTTPEGIEVVIDRNAYSSDGIVLVNRIKWHTNFEAPIESGLFKMMAIGVGRFAGAQRYHTHGHQMGLQNVIRSVGQRVLTSGKILGGVAILEDAYHHTGMIRAVRAAEIEEREQELLATVKSWRGRLPLDAVDVLIVDEIGKEIAGTGMDTKIVNRDARGPVNCWPNAPQIKRIFIRDLTPQTHGNALGIGMADMVTTRLVEKIDWQPTYINALTSGSLPAVKLPMHFATDRECVEKLAKSVGKLDTREVTFCWIRNTLDLAEIAISENLREAIEAFPQAEVSGTAQPWAFDERGNLLSPFVAEVHTPALSR